MNTNKNEELMRQFANKDYKTLSGYPLEYKWGRLTLFGCGLRTKRTVSWNPNMQWDVNTVCVWNEDAILPGTAVIYKN